MEPSTVNRAVEDVRVLVAADGGDMQLVDIDAASHTVNLRLVLDGVSCHECVMPRPILEEIVTGMMRDSIPDIARVAIDDPREHPGYVPPE